MEDGLELRLRQVTRLPFSSSLGSFDLYTFRPLYSSTISHTFEFLPPQGLMEMGTLRLRAQLSHLALLRLCYLRRLSAVLL